MTEEELDAALAEQVAAGRITEQQAAKIKERWQHAKQNMKRVRIMKHLLQMDEAELNEWLAEQIAAGKIDEEQAAKIKERWQQIKERLEQAQQDGDQEE